MGRFEKLIDGLCSKAGIKYDGTAECRDRVLERFDPVLKDGHIHFVNIGDTSGTCVCGKHGVKYVYSVKDKETGVEYPVGSECIELFIEYRYKDHGESARMKSLLTKCKNWQLYFVSLSAALTYTKRMSDVIDDRNELKSELEKSRKDSAELLGKKEIQILDGVKRNLELRRKLDKLNRKSLEDSFVHGVFKENEELTRNNEKLHDENVELQAEIDALNREIDELRFERDDLQFLLDSTTPSYDGE